MQQSRFFLSRRVIRAYVAYETTFVSAQTLSRRPTPETFRYVLVTAKFLSWLLCGHLNMYFLATGRSVAGCVPPPRYRRFSSVVVILRSLRHAGLSGCCFHASPKKRAKPRQPTSYEIVAYRSHDVVLRANCDSFCIMIWSNTDLFDRTFCSHLKIRFTQLPI